MIGRSVARVLNLGAIRVIFVRVGEPTDAEAAAGGLARTTDDSPVAALIIPWRSQISSDCTPAA